MSIGKEELNAVVRVMKSGVLSQYKGNWSKDFFGGQEIQRLEKEWAEYFQVNNAIACNSATSGLWLALAAIGAQQLCEDSYCEVIVTPYSMTCSATIPLLFGAKPVFADIEKDYYCLDPKSVEERITQYTKAIIAVDLFGQPYDADALNEIVERKGKEYGHKIYVIEDAAQAAGAKYKGRCAGTLGDIGVYSLNVHKPIQCGEGGIVVTNDDELAWKIKLLMNHSEAVINDMLIQVPHSEFAKENIGLVGMNLRMTELSAAIAREQLKKLRKIVKEQQENADLYFGNSLKVRPGCEHSFYRYASQNHFKLNLSFTEEQLQQVMHFKQHYITPIYQMPLFKYLGYNQNQCPVCEEVDKDIVLAWIEK